MSASLQRQLPHASSVSLNGRQVPYVTVANPRRKSISIYWTGRVEVRCPPGTTKRRVEAVLKEHADWVLAHLPAEAFRPVVIAMAVLFLTAADRPCLSLVRSALSS